MRRTARLILAAGVLLLSRAALGQSNTAIAESLFRDGKKLLEQRRYDEACPKFKESARLDPSSGVELALGLCLEGQGKTASAWGAYVSAASLARRDGRHDREAAANHHATALEPRLPRVTLEVAAEAAALAGLVVRQDGTALGSETWKGAPADPGAHVLEATAPGKKPFKMTFTIGAGEETSIKVPALEAQPVAPAIPVAAAPPPAPPARSHTGRTVGLVVGGLGVATLAAGAVLGVVALHDASKAHTACPSSPCASPEGVSDNATAGTLADWSTATLVGGGAALLVGAGLVLFTGRSAEPGPAASASVAPVLGLGYAGLTGRF